MQCLQCQHENTSDARFCNQCAAPFAPVCSACGHENAADAKFCNQCGTTLTIPLSAPRPVRSMPPDTESESRFHALLPEVRAMLQREGRVTYRTLKYVFGVDDAFLEHVQSELRFKQLAMDENGEGLVWTGEGQITVHPTVATPRRAVMAETTAVSVLSLPTSSSLVTATDTQITDPTVRSEDAPPDRPPNAPVAGPEPARHVPEAERRAQ